VGTRYEDQPPEHWAGPESLDPTPTWKQFILVGLFLVGLLGVVLAVGALALAPQLVAPPAFVPGGRVVLAVTDLPDSLLPRRFGPPLVSIDQIFWIARPSKGELIAFRERWSPQGDTRCSIGLMLPLGPQRFLSECEGRVYFFGPSGEPLEAPAAVGAPQSAARAPRGLDRYLVSTEGDRVVVNVSRVIYGTDRTPTSAPSP